MPVFASYVYDQNARLLEAGLTPINLTSVMIGEQLMFSFCPLLIKEKIMSPTPGNGMTDTQTLITSFFDMQCTHASVPPILDIRSILSPFFIGDCYLILSTLVRACC